MTRVHGESIPVVLDTSVVRHLAYDDGEVALGELTKAAEGGIPIRIADSTVAELVVAMGRSDGGFSWDDWVRVRERLSRVVDPSRPIVAANRVGLHEAGIRLRDHLFRDSQIADLRAHHLGLWKDLVGAPSKWDLL